MKKFLELIQKSVKNLPKSSEDILKGRYTIMKSDDEKMLAFGWASVSMRVMGIPAGTLPVGWWIGFKVTDKEVWEKVKDGTYNMLSIEGEAERVEIEDIVS